MELRIEWLGLLQQPVDEFLGSADRQCRNVVDGFFGIQLAALSAGMLQRIDHVGANPQQPEFEDLEQATRTRANDDHVGLDRAVNADWYAFAQESTPGIF